MSLVSAFPAFQSTGLALPGYVAYLVALEATLSVAAIVVVMFSQTIHTFIFLNMDWTMFDAVSFLAAAKALGKPDLIFPLRHLEVSIGMFAQMRSVLSPQSWRSYSFQVVRARGELWRDSSAILQIRCQRYKSLTQVVRLLPYLLYIIIDRIYSAGDCIISLLDQTTSRQSSWSFVEIYWHYSIMAHFELLYENQLVSQACWLHSFFTKRRVYKANGARGQLLSLNLALYNSQMHEQSLCPKCKRSFSSQNPPKKLINCSHSLCHQCLIDELVCPIDRTRIEKRKYTVEAFQINHALLQAISISKNSSNLTSQGKGWKLTLHSSSNSPSSEFNTPIVDKYSSKEPLRQKIGQRQAVVVQLPCLSPQKLNQPSGRLTISPKRVKLNFDTCLLHSKKADLVCLEDKCLICSNCGLFGEHKLHKIIPYDQFLTQYSRVTEDSFKIYGQLKERQEKLSEEAIAAYLEEAFKEKRDNEVKHIKSSISGYIDFLKKLEKQLITELDIAIAYKKKKITQKDMLDELITKKEKYIAQIQNMSNGVDDIFNLQNIGQYIDYIDKQSPNSFIINQGEYLLLQIDNFYKQKMQVIAQQTNELTYHFTMAQQALRESISLHSKDIEEINLLIEQNKKKIQAKPYVYNSKIATPHRVHCSQLPASNSIKNELKMSPNIKLNNQDDPLLIGTNSKSGSKGSSTKIIKQNSPIQPYSTFQFDISGKKTTDIKASTLAVNEFSINPSLSRSKRTLQVSKKGELSQSRTNKSRPKSNHNISQTQRQNVFTILSEKNQNTKRKKLDLPDKYQRVYDDLLKDKLQILDLGGAFLGESVILSISQLFASRGKLRAAKLMNNKISDQYFPQLVSRCRMLHSLNLSYNLLTEKSLDWLEQEAEHLGELKNITMSNNKIVLRNVRDRLEGLARRGIKVSL